MRYNPFWGLVLVTSSTLSAIVLIDWIANDGFTRESFILCLSPIAGYISGARMIATKQ